MPLELGLFIAAKRYGDSAQRRKKCIVFDTHDIAGQDIHAHGGTIKRLIESVAAWLRDELQESQIPGGRQIAREYRKFEKLVPRICAAKGLHPDELTFLDYRFMAAEWIRQTFGKRLPAP